MQTANPIQDRELIEEQKLSYTYTDPSGASLAQGTLILQIWMSTFQVSRKERKRAIIDQFRKILSDGQEGLEGSTSLSEMEVLDEADDNFPSDDPEFEISPEIHIEASTGEKHFIPLIPKALNRIEREFVKDQRRKPGSKKALRTAMHEFEKWSMQADAYCQSHSDEVEAARAEIEAATIRLGGS
jgi:hypothetical protein